MSTSEEIAADVAIVGAGAAGLATAIFTRRLNPSRSVVLIDSAPRPGAKILVSGGSRCNVTNAAVSERDFWGGKRTIIRRVLRALPVPDTVAFFEGLGVRLHEEALGKLFPDSNRSRDVLEALLGEVDASGARLLAGTRVADVRPADGGWRLETARGSVLAAAVVLATGGQSLPKSGSDGAGMEIARRLGHSVVPTTPALAPLLLADAPDSYHRGVAGVSHPAGLSVWINGSIAVRLVGSLLWTHFGISGPVVLDASRHWLRARLEGRVVKMTASFCPDDRFESADARWTSLARDRPRATVQGTLATIVPASLATTLLSRLEIDDAQVLAHLSRAARQRLVHALVEWPLDVVDSRGYTFAEATAGGVALEEIDPGTMESRRCPGLYFVGEILDVDGRLGGFNFQWAWASARQAALTLAAR